ncbi:MAG TPA: LLM class flavin-dependent oxidoreductase [Acetobacteraceae bacterium]|nr:LLM class flavin-dependent oxidoreductase [Acetobacteraceae bacterium]
MRQMVLVGFLQAQNCTTLASSWRHPESRIDFTGPEYFQRIAQVLEEGKFQLAFFDDRLAMPDMYGGDHVHTVEYGIRCVKMDPLAVLMTMGAVTTRLGLGATGSTTYYEPFDLARRFQTIDLMLKGRAAWNVVTSVNDGEAMNMGRAVHEAHDLRYDRADEFMEIVLGHWHAWDDDALVVDKESGLFARGDKVHRLDHVGRFYRSRGPFTVPRSPQGHPVVIQAGSSDRGKRFAARWAETVFVAYHGLEQAKAQYAEMKQAIAAEGHDPDKVTLNTIAYPVAAATKAEAEDKMALIDRLYHEVDGLSLLSEALNYDFAKKGMDDAFTAAELAGMSGMQAMRDHVIWGSGKANPTVRDFLHVTKRGRPGQAIVGGPKEIADQMEQWFVERGCDGYVIGGTHTPGTFEDFVTFVVPELQRRGLFQKEYAGMTLRQNLGLPHPSREGWRLAG